MDSDFNIPRDIASVKDQLFEKMKQRRGKLGQYAVEMLEAAERLLGGTEQRPRQTEAAAYHIRQALVEIFGDEKDHREKFEDAVKAVTDARRRIKSGKSQQDEQNVQDLLSAVDDLERHETEPKYRVRLVQIFRRESGIDAVSGDGSLPDTYQRLIDDANEMLHRVSVEGVDHNAVRKLYIRSIDILTMVFLPDVRLQHIANLAQLRKPQKSDARRLEEIMVNAYGFDHFADNMVSSDWFGLINPDMLKSASDGQPWLLRSLAHRLKYRHVDKFVQFVEKNFGQWTAEDTGLAELGYVGKILGDNGLPLLVRALQKGESSRQRCNRELAKRSKTKSPKSKRDKVQRVLDSIGKLENYALQAYQAAEPTNPALAELADRLMDRNTNLQNDDKINAIPAKLAKGIGPPPAAERIKVLAYKTRTHLKNELLYIPVLGSVTGTDQYAIGMSSMVGSLRRVLARARDHGMPTMQMVGMLSVLPDGVRHRLVAWLYSGADDVDPHELIDFIADGCRSRRPTGDDELLLTRLERDGHLDRDVNARICGLIRDAPNPKRMDGRPREWDLDKEDLWRILWAHMLHSRIELPDGWGPCIEILNPLINEERRVADRWMSGRWMSDTRPAQESPVGPEISGDEDPHAAAAKIAAWSAETPGRLAHGGESDMARKLTNAIKRNAPKWAEDPVEMVNTLHYPAHVAEYFNCLAGSMKELSTRAGGLIPAVRFARTHPWNVAAPASPPFGYYGSWEGVDAAGINLLEAMAKENVPLDDDELREAWELLSEAVTDMVGEFPEGVSENLIDAASRKPHTRALNTTMHMIVYAANRKKDIPEKVQAALTELVMLTGRNGKECRVFLGMWAKQLRIVLPGWFEQHEPRLLGNEAPEGLGQVTLDMHLLGGEMDQFILEKYRGGVLDAVKRGADGAMGCLLRCMLQGMPGYEPNKVAESLTGMGSERISEAVWKSALLLRKDASPDQTRRGTDFWKEILNLKPEPETLVGFGRWAMAADISQSRWENLTWRTCNLAGKKLDYVWGVAERVRLASEVTETGLQILAWLMNADLGYHTDRVAEHALEALRKSKDALGTQEAWTCLQEMMLWHGYNEATDL